MTEKRSWHGVKHQGVCALCGQSFTVEVPLIAHAHANYASVDPVPADQWETVFRLDTPEIVHGCAHVVVKVAL